MFELPSRLKAALEARLLSQPVNARHLIIAAGVDFEEMLLPTGMHAILSRENAGFRLAVSQDLGWMAMNIVYAKALAHLLLHADRFAPSTAWVDGSVQEPPVAHSLADLGPEEEAAAIGMATEILIPTVALRETFLYHQGDLTRMAQAFGVPRELVRRACVHRGLLDARSSAA